MREVRRHIRGIFTKNMLLLPEKKEPKSAGYALDPNKKQSPLPTGEDSVFYFGTPQNSEKNGCGVFCLFGERFLCAVLAGNAAQGHGA